MDIRFLAAFVPMATVLTTCTCTCTVPSGPTPVYVTVAGHIEEHLGYADPEDCTLYKETRANLLEFAEVVRAGAFDFNLQAGYEWFIGVSLCEDEDLMLSTDGLNIVDYLVREYDFEIDVHQEGADTGDGAMSRNNFADIRYVAGLVTATITETTGFQWDNPEHYDSLQNGQTGLLHPGFTWWPEILAGGVSQLHTEGNFLHDMTTIGGWIPSGFSEAEFHVHDTSADARMFYVGSGPNQHTNDWGRLTVECHFDSTADFVSRVAEYIADGTLASDELYTTTLFVPQRVMFDSTMHGTLEKIIEDLEPLVSSGQVVYAHFIEVAEHWRTDYDSRPNIVQYDRIRTDDDTCEESP